MEEKLRRRYIKWINQYQFFIVLSCLYQFEWILGRDFYVENDFLGTFCRRKIMTFFLLLLYSTQTFHANRSVLFFLSLLYIIHRIKQMMVLLCRWSYILFQRFALAFFCLHFHFKFKKMVENRIFISIHSIYINGIFISIHSIYINGYRMYAYTMYH